MNYNLYSVLSELVRLHEWGVAVGQLEKDYPPRTRVSYEKEWADAWTNAKGLLEDIDNAKG